MTPTTYSGLVAHIIDIINLIIPALFGGLFVYFIWKMIDSWVINAGDEKKVEEGKKYATAAVLMFVLMIITWGIVALIKDSLF